MTDSEQQTRSPAANSSVSHDALETPSWLLGPATGGGLPPPVQTLNQLLPLSELSWDDFERLCLRLLRTEVGAVRAALYGLPGQAQHGIDMYAIAPIASDEDANPRRYVTLQSRRISNVSPASLENCVNDFLVGNWADVSQKFVYATSSSVRSTQIREKIEELAKRLDPRSIVFEVWDQEEISEKLKGRPELVDDFFGRPWVTAFCGEGAANQLGNRLDAREMADLRRELARIYATTFGLADPGFAGFGLNKVRRVELLERFVTPDLTSVAHQTASYPYDVAVETEVVGQTPGSHGDFGTAQEWNALLPDEYSWSVQSAFGTSHNVQPAASVERRPADQWVGTERLQVIIGDPGAGKSALLRYLVLDLLREEPRWKTVAVHWGEYLPVWLPFHFLAQRVVGQTGEFASVGLALKAWLEQNESAQIWPLIEKALEDRRLLLVVDGLDEWTSDNAGHYAARAVEKFAAIRGIPVLASTRPYGLTKLTLDAGWVYSRIAPLTYDQQRSLAIHYFRAATDTDSPPRSAEIIDRTVDEFLGQVQLVPELSSFSGTPLFLIMLVTLRLSSSSSLPAQRFEVYERAVQLLVEDLPPRRRTAADVAAAHRGLSHHEMEAVLRKVSYVNQLRGDVSVLEEDALREDFIDALQDPSHLSMSRENAVNSANQLLDVAEGELGILVRVGPNQVGFIHRVIQEHLAAEYVANRLEFEDVQALFQKYVGNPAWKEVLLITVRKISRPSELSALLAVIRGRIGETPAGLCAREFLAEITFGPYGLPVDAVQTNATDIIKVVETHAYGPHRARLLNAVLSGLSGPLTGSIVRDCLERWTLLGGEPSRELVSQISKIPPDTGLSETVCPLLVFALRNADRYDAFDNASTIAVRCSTIGTDEERHYLRAALLNILADPPSGLVQSAALAALALGWRQDPKVAAILDEARSHPDEQVRSVALCDALNVLADVFPDITEISRPATQVLTDSERKWLIEHLWTQETPEVHFGMLVAAISAVVQGDQALLSDLMDFNSSPEVSHFGSEVMRAVMLRAFADNESLANWVCDQIRAEGLTGLKQQIRIGDIDPLVRAYRKGSPHNGRVAESIEHFLSSTDTKFMDRTLHSLAAIDQGPVMREALLKELGSSSSFPHWAASALGEHFVEDVGALAELRSMIMGDPARASMVANAASSVLGPHDVIKRLLDILRSLDASPSSSGSRYDIVASALIRAYRELGPNGQKDVEHVMREAIDFIPKSLNWLYGNPRLALAAELYPAEGSVQILNEMGESQDRPLVVFLRVFRKDAENLKPFLADASKALRSLPAYLRAHICWTLAERGVEPRLVTDFTARWADERSGPNKSVASLAYHQALKKIRREQPGNDELFALALTHLGEQASVYGPDYEERRRAAWVGMCILEDWSPVLDHVKTTSDTASVSVGLTDDLNGPDRILLQQIAATWEKLRTTFGDQLFALLSGPLERGSLDSVWNSLALVAAENPLLERELENELVANPQLRTLGGIFLWTVSRRVSGSAEISEILISLMRDSRYSYNEPVGYLLDQPERIGLQPEQLQEALEQAARGSYEGPAIESLAALFPDHHLVQNAWRIHSELMTSSGHHSAHRINPRTYFALAYSVASSDEIVAQIQRHHDRLCKIGNPYFDRVFARQVSHRLRRDHIAAGRVRDAIVNPDTPDSLAAVFVSLLRNAVGLDDGLLTEIDRRISQQMGRRLATVVRDPHAGANLPVRAILVGAAEGARDARSV